MMRRELRTAPAAIAAVILILFGCTDQQPTDPATLAPTAQRNGGGSSDTALSPRLVRQLAAARGIGRLADAPHVRPALAELGQALMFDPILSGNHDVSCATCHITAFSTGDGRSLSVGAGGTGLGPNRTSPDGVFIPRNAPPVFDLAQLRHMFWDGRVETDGHGHFTTPAQSQLTPSMQRILEFGAISAQPMFPVAARAEMRGQSGNELTTIADDDYTDIWSGL
ncbi:MAG TPA: cytochrome-c peroxidase, partial [Gemmatimonadaceae bacterium]|nr:cytochrome-c peroxidase [Gemmatimonadaceae bacterium]